MESGVSQLSLDRSGSPHPLRTSSIAPPPDQPAGGAGGNGKGKQKEEEFVVCPLCTFHNHPSILQCEMCNTTLQSTPVNTPAILPTKASQTPDTTHIPEEFNKPIDSIKVSFRGGGSQEFHQKLKDALIQRKWICRDAPSVPKPGTDYSKPPEERALEIRKPIIGIAGLERRGEDVRKKNEDVMGGAFEDLEALKARAKDMVPPLSPSSLLFNTT